MKTTKKCLSLLLSFAMVFSFVCIPAMAEDAAGTATTEKEWHMLSDTPVFEQNFDVVNEDGTLAGDGSIGDSTAEYSVSNGELHMVGLDNRFSYSYSSASLTDKNHMIELDIRKEDNQQWGIAISNSASSITKTRAPIYLAFIPSRDSITVHYSTTTDAGDGTTTSTQVSKSVTLDGMSDTGNYHIACWLNHETSSFSAWINGVQIASEFGFYCDTTTSVINIFSKASTQTNLHIDNIKITLPDETPRLDAGEAYYQNLDFNGTIADITQADENDTDYFLPSTFSSTALAVSNGELVVSGKNKINLRHGAFYGMDDRIVFDFVLRNGGTNPRTSIYINDGGNTANSATLQLYFTNGFVQYYDGATQTSFTYGATDKKINLKVIFEKLRDGETTTVTDNEYKFSLWVDGVKYVDRADPKTKMTFNTSTNAINRYTLVLTTDSADATRLLYIDDLKIYQAELDPEAAVAAAKENVTLANIANYDSNGELASLKTSLEGANGHGCKLGYISNGNLIRPAGAVNFPLVAATDTVTPVIYTRGYWEALDSIAIDVPSVYNFGVDKTIAPAVSGTSVSAVVPATAKSTNAPAITTVTAVYDGTELIGIKVNDAATISDGGFAVSANAEDASGKTVKVFVLKDANGIYPLTEEYTGTPMKVAIHVYKTEHTTIANNGYRWSMWIDNNCVINHAEPQKSISKSSVIGYMIVRTVKKNGASVTLDNFKAYQAVLTDSQKVAKAVNELVEADLTTQSLSALTGNLNLPLTGVENSTISWSSSDTDVITNDGKVKRPAQDTTLTLTATVSVGLKSDTKAFEVTVLKKEEEEEIASVFTPKTDNSGNPLYAHYLSFDNMTTATLSQDLSAYQVTVSGSDRSNMKDMSINSNGALVITSADAAAHHMLRLGTDTYKAYTDDIVIEFDMALSADSGAVLWISDGGTGAASQRIRMEFMGTSLKYFCYDNTTSAIGEEFVTIPFAVGQSYHYELIFTKTTNTAIADNLYRWSLYVDGEPVVVRSEPQVKIGSMSHIGTVNFRTGANGASYTLDNLHAYSAELTDEQKVEKDYDNLVDSVIASQALYAIETDLTLIKTGTSGTSISWESSNKAVVSNDGSVTRDENGDVSLTLTATIKSGEATKTKTFNVTVVKKEYVYVPSPEVDDDGNPITLRSTNFDTFTTETLADDLSEYSPTNTQNMSIKDGQLVVTPGSEAASHRFNLGSTQLNSVEDKLTIELDLTLSTDGETHLWFGDGASTAANQRIRIQLKNDKITYYHADTTTTINNPSAPGKKSKYIIMLTKCDETEVSGNMYKWSLWVDGNLVVDKADPQKAITSHGTVASFVIRTIANGSCVVSVDNLRTYQAAFTDQEKVDKDYEKLIGSVISAEPLEALRSDLTLPERGEFRSYITWESSNTDVISLDGEVKPSSESDVEVTLTATIKSGEIFKAKTFNITVMRLIEYDAPGVLGDYLINDTMKSDKLSNLIYVYAGSPSATSSGIAIKSGDSFEYYFDKAYTGYSKPLGFDFTLDGSGTRAEIYDNEEVLCFGVKQEDGTISVLVNTADGSIWKAVKTSAPSNVSYTVLSEPMSGTFSVWANGEQIAANLFGASSASKIYKIMFVQESGNSVVSDYKAYFADVPEAGAASFDAAWLTLKHLTWQSADRISESIELPTTGKAGSTIVWTSSNENVIATDGTVKMPSSGSVPVTLTATVTSGKTTIVKNFNLTVIQMQKDEMPEVKKMIIEEDFDGNSLSSDWTFEEQNGTIAVVEEALRVTRTSNLLDSEGASIVTCAELYFDPMKAYLQGTYGFEYTLRRNDNKTVQMRLKGVNHYFSAVWREDGDLTVYRRITEEDTSYTTEVVPAQKDAIKLTVLFNTNESTFSLWIDGKMVLNKVGARVEKHGGIRNIRMYLDGSSYTSFEVDNIRFYEAYNLTEDRVRLDKEWLTESVVTNPNDSAVSFGYIGQDLVLPSVGNFGSKITYTSSNPNVISETGVITPANDFTKVKLIANITSGSTYATKELWFTFMPAAGTPAEAAAKDAELLTLDAIASHNGGSSDIIRSLNLVSAGAYGSAISWASDDTEHITESGRVIRPKWDEANAPVKMTATITNGGASVQKEFDFIVLADEKFVDNVGMSDEEFFGVWDGSKWTTEPKWNYSYSGLAEMETAAKAGNYALAKEKLLYYFQNDRPSRSTISASNRNVGFVNMTLDDFYMLNSSKYYQGSFYATNDWTKISAEVKTADLEPGNMVSYSLRAWYNESSFAEVARANSKNASLRPRLELTVNGTVRTYDAVDDIGVRAGQYKSTNFDSDEYLKLQTFGDFLADDTRYGIIKFDLSDLASSDNVTSAKLVVYARAVPDYSGEKRIIIIKETGTEWSGDSATWDSFIGCVYSFNGLPGKNHWRDVEGSNAEYHPQSNRFGPWPAVAAEYLFTKDEEYAYKALRIMEDFVTDNADWKSTSTGYAYDENGLRGNYPRTLDNVSRMSSWSNSIDIFSKSKYATPDNITAFMKSLWDTANYMTYYNTKSGNWRQYEHQAIMTASLKLPEFTDSTAGRNWRKIASDELESMLFLNSLEDGSYIEACDSYAKNAFSGFADYKATMINAGGDVTPEYDKRLHDMAYYIALLYAPDGTGPQYGDSGPSSLSASTFSEVVRWYDDSILEFIANKGTKGTQPAWTSRHFPASSLISMRASWTQDSPWIATNVRGGGQHGHCDANNVILYAYGRMLLTDAGIFTYDGHDPYRQYGYSSLGHNTVIINDISSTESPVTDGRSSGTVHEFTTNSQFDYSSASTPLTKGYDHRRTITFIKPDIFIVSDRMTPDNMTNTNNYKQLWHMRPDAGLEVSSEDNTISSNYPTGANLIIASADGESVSVVEANGWYDRGSNDVQAAKYGYVEKKNARGTTTLDTVLMPNNGDISAKVKAEKLSELTSETAVKLSFTKNNSDYIGYYYMSYENGSGKFGKYKTDAQLSYVQENEFGEVVTVVLKDGSYILNTETSESVFESTEKIAELHIDMSGSEIYITTDSDANAENFTVNADKNVIGVFVNNSPLTYNASNGVISSIGNGNTSSENENTKVPEGGIQMPNKDNGNSTGGGGGSVGGGSIGGGSIGGGSIGGGSIGGGESASGLADVSGHWAQNEITALHSSGIVNGDTSGNYNPDSSIKRSEFIAIAVRSLGIEIKAYRGSFADVDSSAWYASVVQTALDHGLISADTKFRPDDLITRQEIAKIISNMANLHEKYTITGQLSYLDVAQIHDWAVPFVDYITQSGLMKGRADGSFGPTDNATRAEAAVVIHRLLGK